MIANMDRFSVFILAGGKSTRMGRDKAFLFFERTTLLQRALQTATAATPDVFIVGDKEKFSSFGSVVEDQYRGQGPLAGIHAALRQSANDLNLIVGVDLPFVSATFLGFLAERAEKSKAMVTIPRAEKRLQPLCAVYRRAFADLAEVALKVERNRIDSLLTSAIIEVIEEDEWKMAGFPGNLFQNVNTPDDLAAAERREIRQ
jgi:molybdopterin-guanine dinucleotide biosynthesis protein A